MNDPKYPRHYHGPGRAGAPGLLKLFRASGSSALAHVRSQVLRAEPLMIVVTGATGLLGANVVATGMAQGRELVAISNRNAIEASGLRSLRIDLASPGVTNQLIRELTPEWIIHCAALTNVDWCEDHPASAELINAEMPRAIAGAAAAVGSNVLYISTDAVFDGASGNYEETDRVGPLNTYARTKRAGELAVLAQLGQRALVLRTNIYGWNLLPKMSLAEWILDGLSSGRGVDAFTDATFTPIFAGDLAELIWKMTDLKLAGEYHVAGGEAISKWSFALRIATTFGFDVGLVRPMSILDAGFRARRPMNTSLATMKAARVLGADLPWIDEGLTRFRAFQEAGSLVNLRAMGGHSRASI